MRKRLIITLLLIVVLGAAAYFYTNNIFLPVKLKGLILNKGQEFLHRKISFRNIEYDFPQGIVVTGIKIYDKDEQKPPLLEVDTITFNILFSALLTNRQIVIPSFTIYKPIVRLERWQDNLWNFSDILNRPKTSSSAKAPNVILGAINISGGEFHFLDKSRENEFTESITDIDLSGKISMDRNIDLSLTALIPGNKSYIDIRGKYHIKDKKFTGNASLGNLPLEKYFLQFNTDPNTKLKTGFLTQANLTSIEYRSDGINLSGNLNLKNINYTSEGKIYTAENIDIHNADIAWKDQLFTASGALNLTNVDLNFANNKTLKGNIHGNISKFNLSPDTAANSLPLAATGSNLQLEGDMDIQNGYLALGDKKNIRGNISAEKFALSKKGQTIHFTGNLTGNKIIVFENDQTHLESDLATINNLNLTFMDEALKIDGLLALEKINLAMPPLTMTAEKINSSKLSLTFAQQKLSVVAEGDLLSGLAQFDSKQLSLKQPSFAVSFSFDPNSEAKYQYDGTVTLAGDSAKGLPNVDQITNATGTIQFKTNQFKTDALFFHTKNTDITLSGSINNPAQPILDIKASSDNVDLKEITTLFAGQLAKLNLNLSGEASAKIQFKGPLASPEFADYQLEGQLNNATVSQKNLPADIVNTVGNLKLTKNQLTWRNFKGMLQNKEYSFSGKLVDFSRPVLEATLSGPDVSLSTNINILHSAFQVTSLAGKYYNSALDIKGDVHLNPDGPKLDLRGNLNLNLKDLPFFMPAFKEKIDQYNPTGEVALEVLLQGNPNKWREMALSINAKSPEISILGNPFNDLALKYEQRDSYVSRFEITSKLYDGELAMSSSINFAEENIPVNLTTRLEHLKLATLRNYRKLKNRDLAGDLSATVQLTGKIKEINSLEGEGSLTINDGNLWEWNILQGLWGAMLIPEFKNVVFTTATSGFSIRERKILTENTELVSNSVKLSAKGWVDFDKNINFLISPTFSEIARLQSDSPLQKLPSGLLTQIIHIKLTGTLDNPQYKVESSALKVLEKTSDVLKEGFKGILEEILK